MKKNIFEIWTSRGVILAFQYFTPNLRMFLDPFELRIENFNKSFDKTVFIIRSQWSGNVAEYVQKIVFLFVSKFFFQGM